MKDKQTPPQTDTTAPRPIGQIRHRLSIICTIVTIISQLLVFGIGILVFNALDQLDPSHAFMISIASTIVIEVIAIKVISEVLLYPLDILARAISSTLHEHPTVYPPNPNRTYGPVKNELARSIDFIYNEHPIAQAPDNSSGQMALELLHKLPVGVVALDAAGRTLAYNTQAPIRDTPDGHELQLDFSDCGQTLMQWLAKVRDQSISANQTWTRIQNVPAGSLAARHVYDVVASYHQHPANEINVIVITIDRTADYVESEDNVDFVALAAHELRGPITVIRGYLDMLDEELYDTATKSQRDLLDRLNVSARRLVSYINNVLNANRYDRRHLKLKLTETRVADIVNDVEGDLNLRASTVNRHLVWQIPDNLPTVAADRSSISEVITNLVDNAIKYSYTDGKIEITAGVEGDFVKISVIDHGIGIAASARDRLFTKFYRSHRSSTSIGGSGIGLYISRAIVESQGGAISVDSTEGKGSTFSFTLPIYATVKDKLAKQNNSNDQLITSNRNRIQNHGTIKD